MKRLLTYLEEKRVLACILAAIAVLTACVGVSVYQVSNEQENGKKRVQQTEEIQQMQEVQEKNIPSEREVAALDLLENTNDPVNGQDAEEKIPNANEVGSQILVEQEKTQVQSLKETVGDVMEENQQNEELSVIEVQAYNPLAISLLFDQNQKLSWPVAQRTVLMEYSMDHTIYHATLNQYSVSPGVLLQSQPGSSVLAPANAQVVEIGVNEEIGTYAVLKLAEEYKMILGNLTEVSAAVNQYIEKGTELAKLAEPTKYYSVEGPNLYVELRYQDKPIDPLLYFE